MSPQLTSRSRKRKSILKQYYFLRHWGDKLFYIFEKSNQSFCHHCCLNSVNHRNPLQFHDAWGRGLCCGPCQDWKKLQGDKTNTGQCVFGQEHDKKTDLLYNILKHVKYGKNTDDQRHFNAKKTKQTLSLVDTDVIDNQCCGSKYNEFGSGSRSRILAQFGAGSRKLLNMDLIRIRIHNTAKYIFCQLSLNCECMS